MFDQDGDVLTDDSTCEVCNPCALSLPDGAHQLTVTLAELVFAAGGTWPSGLTGVRVVVYTDDAGAGVVLRAVSGTNPALDVSGTWEARTLPSGVVYGGSVAYEAADTTLRSLSSVGGAELLIVRPEAM